MDTLRLLGAITALEPRAKQKENTDRAAVEVPVDAFYSLMGRLKSDPQLAFDMLYTHTAVDWSAKGEGPGEFELVYQLYSMTHGHYLLVSTRIPRDNPVAPTVSPIWKIAEWQEREVYDMFGVLYENHRDLRRLFLEDGWNGFPLRKDYKDEFMLERPE